MENRLWRKLHTDRTNDGAKERSSREETGSQTTLRSWEHVRNDTAGVGQGGRAKGTSKEPQNDQGLYVLGASGTCIKEGQEHIGPEEEILPPVEFWGIGVSIACAYVCIHLSIDHHSPLKGAQIKGPIAKPRTNSDMPKVAMICATPNSSMM
jgi:hypothetical protein